MFGLPAPLAQRAFCALGVLFLFSLFSISSHAQSFHETKLTANDGWAADRFGSSVSLSGDYLIAGSPGDDLEAGAAYIFKQHADGTWLQTAKLTASDRTNGDLFGEAVVLSSTHAIIGSRKNTDHGVESGSAYIFERQADESWIEVAKLTASDATASQRFGSAVSIVNGLALVGAPEAGGLAAPSGSAYLYEEQANGEWVEIAKLKAGDATPSDLFGFSFALSNERALISAYASDELGGSSGAVYVFEPTSDGTWTQIQKLIASDGTYGDLFGFGVAMEGDQVIIGAPGEQSRFISAGAAYTFERQPDGSWQETSKIISSDLEAWDNLGRQVSISDNLALVASAFDDDNGSTAGALYVYTKNENGHWAEREKVLASDGEPGDYFGWDIALNEGKIAIGAFSDDDLGGGAGAVYVYSPAFAVTSFTLINAHTNQPIPGYDPLSDGDIINVDELPTHKLSVRANAPELVESVLMKIRTRERVENNAPYALFGDLQGNYIGRTFRPNTYTISATAYSGNDLTGVQGATSSIQLTFIRGEESTSIVRQFNGYPNPFNPQTTLFFDLKEDTHIELKVFDMLGREVAVLVDDFLTAGSHQAIFEAGSLPSGVYYARLATSRDVETSKLTLMK